ncbi:glycosyltransferase [Leptothermofonsia sp. ETS-13]|uniref:glycosyltransferase n=1 Tax=Leptothermofonsia sp. ETS-13 TaxID=3035696 RepID=UPI003BA13992
MSDSRFTFCIPNLNKAKYLPACIDSILAQDYSNWRCVLVDGYSTDGSWEYVQQYAADPRFLLLRGTRQGMYADWNECLRHLETEYFYFLTSDDTCFPELASTAIAALDSHPDIDACHFPFDLIDAAGTVIIPHQALVQKAFGIYSNANQTTHRRSGLTEFMMHFVYRALYQTITSLVFRRSLIPKLEGFSSDYGVIGDYDWTMRLGLYTDTLYIPKRLATWRVYEGQATDDAMMPHVTEDLLAIAQKNLALFKHSKSSQKLKKPLDDSQILADLQNEHACSLFRATRKSQSIPQAFNYLTALITTYPLYLIKKALNRISRDRLYPYLGRDQLARQLIAEYGLPWDFTRSENPQDYSQNLIPSLDLHPSNRSSMQHSFPLSDPKSEETKVGTPVGVCGGVSTDSRRAGLEIPLPEPFGGLGGVRPPNSGGAGGSPPEPASNEAKISTPDSLKETYCPQILSIIESYLGHRTYGDLMKNYFSQSTSCQTELYWYNDEREFTTRLINRLLSLCIPNHWVQTQNLDFRWFRIQYGFSYLARRLALRKLKQTHYSVLHFHTQALALASLDLIRKHPTVISLDMTAAQASRIKTAPNLRWTYAPNLHLEKRIYETAASMVTFSQAARQSVIEDYSIDPDKVRVIYPGVDLTKITPAEKPSNQTPYRILFVGGDFERKGGQDLLTVFLETLADQAELHLVTKADITCSHPNIHIYRNITAYTPEWLSLYQQADVFVMPTYAEPFGWVFIEAMAAGLPIIATRISAIPEIVTHGETGFLVEPGDRHSLAKSIRTLMNNPALGQTMGMKGRKIAEQKFNAHTNFQILESLFHKVALRAYPKTNIAIACS